MKKIALIASALLVSGSLYAEPIKGAYVGLGAGSSVFNDGGVKDDLNDAIAPSKVGYDYADTGLKMYGGYQFNKVVAVELSYTNYGKYDMDYAGYNLELNPTAISVAVNVGYNLGSNGQYRPFVIAGVSSVSFGENGNLKAYDSDSVTAFRFGVGYEYSPVALKHMSFRVAYEGDFYSLIDANPNNDAGYSDTYAQSMSMLYVGASYKF